MFQITFLGTSGSVPTVDRGMPSISLRYGNHLMLWDCGEGTQRQLMKYKVGYGSINSIFITHPHPDHYLGLIGLLETLKISAIYNKKIDIYLPSTLLSLFGNLSERYSFVKVHKIRSGELFRTKEFSVSAFRVKHCKDAFGFVLEEADRLKFHEKKAHSLGLRGEMFRQIQHSGQIKTEKGTVKLSDISWKKPGRKVVYSGDCLPSESTLNAAKGASILIHEATFDELMKNQAKERMHSTNIDAARLAKSAGAKNLVLTHISPRYSDEESNDRLLSETKAVFPPTQIARDGLSIDVIDVD
ncbi:MAG: ribonuclease Z [Candidatus Bilamarchaeum sp.]|jgi:ribonuclease Z